jgi:hypothetical protein
MNLSRLYRNMGGKSEADTVSALSGFLCSASPPRCEILAHTACGRVAAGARSRLRPLAGPFWRTSPNLERGACGLSVGGPRHSPTMRVALIRPAGPRAHGASRRRPERSGGTAPRTHPRRRVRNTKGCKLGEPAIVCYTLPADVEICDGLRNLRSVAAAGFAIGPGASQTTTSFHWTIRRTTPRRMSRWGN